MRGREAKSQLQYMAMEVVPRDMQGEGCREKGGQRCQRT